MNIMDFLNKVVILPPFLIDCTIIAAILGLIEISPLKINPWKWIKSFIQLPTRLNRLENEFNNDRAYRWRSMILSRSDHVRRKDKLSEERWGDTIETIDRYEKYCNDNPEFKNGKATTAIQYLREQYKIVYEKHDYLT